MTVKANERPPRFYGLAWHNCESNSYTAFIIPFNFIAGWSMRARMILKMGPDLMRSSSDKSIFFKGSRKLMNWPDAISSMVFWICIAFISYHAIKAC